MPQVPCGQMGCNGEGATVEWEREALRYFLIHLQCPSWCSADVVYEGCGGVYGWLHTKDQAPGGSLMQCTSMVLKGL
jgi:hypothetical protein